METEQVFKPEEYFQKYAQYLERKSKNTKEGYIRNIKPFLTYLQKKGIDNPTYHSVELYFDDLLNHPKETHMLINDIDYDEVSNEERQILDSFRYKDRTVRTYRNMLNQFFKWLEREGYYENIVARADNHIPIPRGHAKDAIDIEDVHKLLEFLEAGKEDLTGMRDYAIILTALTTGLRTIELSRANYEDIQRKGINTVIYVQGKGRREHDEFVILPRNTKEVIREYTTMREKEGLMINTDLSPLFASHGNRNKGGRMTTRSIGRVITKAYEAVGIHSSKITPHSLRHTAATMSLVNGGNLRETQKMLRHSSVRTTEIYAQDLDEDKNMSTQLIEDYIKTK